jgi:tetratricopeptide (TPR) repeat protein
MFSQFSQRLRSLFGGRSEPIVPGAAPAAGAHAGIQPDEVQALVEQAARHYAQGETEDARDCYETALAHAPNCIPALAGLAALLRDAGAADEALEYIQHALRIAPHDATMCFESALTLNRCGDTQGALAAYQQALELKPRYAAANVNLGLIYLTQLGDPLHAERFFERAIEIDPGAVAAQANLGLALQEQGRTDAALAHYERLITAHPAVNEYRWNRGIALLSRGDYARGWEDYELRNARGTGAPPRLFPYPVWHGEALAGSTLLVYGEQGIGDEIMFASCVPDLLARGTPCVIECDQRLATLFERSFPAARVHGAARDGDRSWLTRHTDVRVQIAIGSLPRLLRRDESQFPRHGGYLCADPGRVAQWRARLAAEAGGRSVGISWRGGTVKTRRDQRAIPLSQLTPLFDVPRLAWVNLQRGGGQELAALAALRRVKVLSYDDALDDMDDTAALIQALECVVTADNTVAHLAGALGRRVLLMLPWHADWRWLDERSTSPWYPSVALYRQQQTDDWASVIARVAAELQS